MIKKCLFLLVIILSAFRVFSQSNGDTGTLILYRDIQIQGNKLYYPVELNGQKIANAKGGTYFVKDLQPGAYRISAKTEVEAYVDINILAHDTVYIRCGVNMGMWIGRPDIVLVDKNFGHQTISSANLKDISSEIFKEFTPKGSVGLVFGGAAGFENIDMFLMDNGKYAQLSSGGGFHFGIMFSHGISKHFEMCYDVKYHGGGLTPSLKNASADFGRGIGSVSLYSTIPLKSDFFRLKFGAGIGCHFGTNLEIDSKEIDGNLYTAKYKSTIDYRIGGIFGTYINSFGYTIGIHYNIVSYEATEAKVNGVPAVFNDDKIEFPKGNGLEFSLGYHFLF